MALDLVFEVLNFLILPFWLHPASSAEEILELLSVSSKGDASFHSHSHSFMRC